MLAYGATLQEVVVPDRDGRRENVALGFGTVAEYRAHGDAYFGATIGRYANRIADGRFTLDGRTYSLPQNDRGNCLHGGTLGFDKQDMASSRGRRQTPSHSATSAPTARWGSPAEWTSR